jgi:hypothetical protein
MSYNFSAENHINTCCTLKNGEKMNGVKFVNLTPHEITIVRGDEKIVIPPSGLVARVRATEEKVGEVDGIPVVVVNYGDVENLPAPEDGTIYLVSQIVLGAVRGRSDVLAPNTGKGAVRDAHGNVAGVTSLIGR